MPQGLDSTARGPQPVPTARSAEGRRPPPLLIHASPVDLALQGSCRARRGERPPPFCAEVGRRLLRAELQFSTWVLRRVETIAFEDDRNVRREMSVDLNVPEDAPKFVDEDGRDCWLVPVTVMRRMTVVQFHMCDEDGSSLGMPGLRLVQQLDQSLLIAAAATVPGPDGGSMAEEREVLEFVSVLVAGRADEVRASWKAYDKPDPRGGAPLEVLRGSAVFHSVARQLRTSFSLYVFLPVAASRHRLLRMSFVEPINWTYQRPILQPYEPDDGAWEYRTGRPIRMRHPVSRIAAATGWCATRIRFQVPSAERAAS